MSADSLPSHSTPTPRSPEAITFFSCARGKREKRGEEMLDKLKTLSSITRVKQADYIREGIAYVLEKYKGEFRKALKGGR